MTGGALRLFGSLLLLSGGILTSSMLCREKMRSQKQLRDWIRFFERLSEEIGCRLLPPDELYASLSFPTLEDAGLLPLLRRGVFFADAYAACRENFILPDRAKEVLEDFSQGFGGGYREEEIARAKHTASALYAVYEGERVAFLRDIRLCRTLPLAASFALMLLLL